MVLAVAPTISAATHRPSVALAVAPIVMLRLPVGSMALLESKIAL